MRQRVFEQFICSNTTMPNCGEGVERLARRMRGFQAPCIRWQAHTPKAFSLRRRWAALAARMRCSRRSGVILYIAMITAISWPTPHQSAHADSFSSRRSLWADALDNYCKPPRGDFAHQPSRIIPAPRGSAAFQLNLIDFYVTHRFFVSFLTQERNVSFASPRPFLPPRLRGGGFCGIL